MAITAADICRVLKDSGSCDATGLAYALGVTEDDVLPILRSCEKTGYVTSAKLPDDRRVFALLPAGKTEIDREEHLDTLLDTLTEIDEPINVQRAAAELALGLEEAEIIVARAGQFRYVAGSADSISITDRGRKKLANDRDLGRYPRGHL